MVTVGKLGCMSFWSWSLKTDPTVFISVAMQHILIGLVFITLNLSEKYALMKG